MDFVCDGCAGMAETVESVETWPDLKKRTQMPHMEIRDGATGLLHIADFDPVLRIVKDQGRHELIAATSFRNNMSPVGLDESPTPSF